jgi:hypothetical protein
LEKALDLALTQHMGMEQDGNRDEIKRQLTQWIEHVSPLR